MVLGCRELGGRNTDEDDEDDALDPPPSLSLPNPTMPGDMGPGDSPTGFVVTNGCSCDFEFGDHYR